MMKPPVSEIGKERESSDALAAARREEIVDACAQLYEEMPFKDVTILKIGEKTSFTRTSVYNYFRTKEEIFLALLEREYRTWTKELDALAEVYTIWKRAAGWKSSPRSSGRTESRCRRSDGV